MRGLEKLLNRERENLNMVKERLDRLKTNNGEPTRIESPNYAAKLGATKETGSIHESPISQKERNEIQNQELASY